MGGFTAAAGLGALITLTLTPMLLIGGEESYLLAETTMMKMLIIVWAGYAVGVGAQGIWDFDERAIGFYAAFATIASIVALVYFSTVLFDPYGIAVTIALSMTTATLAIVGGMTFFHYAVPFNVLRLVAGWFMLVGSVVVAGIGFAIVGTIIEVVV